MEYKNTVEAMNINSEEIHRLIAGLKETEEISRIDIDLILQKLRSLYDLVLDVQEAINEKKASPKNIEPTIQDKKPEPVPEYIKPKVHTDEKYQDKGHISSDLGFEDTAILLKEKIFFKTPAVEKTDEEKLQERKQTAKENIEKDLKLEKEKSDGQSVKQTYVSDRFKTSKPTLHEELANKIKPEEHSPTIKTQNPLTIGSSLGLNEKFELISELFGGSKEKFESTMQILNKAGSFVEAYNYLQENFNWDMDSQFVQRLLEIIRQKLIIRRNDQ
jgi:hypothetical protein